MLNFNGQLKKRTVNLGGGAKRNRAQILHNAQREREKREQERKLEHDVVLIQKKIRRFLELLQARLIESEQWSQRIGQRDLNAVIFQFNMFYSFVFKHNVSRLPQIKLIVQILSHHSIQQLSEANIRGLYDTITTSLHYINADENTESEILDGFLKVLSFLPLDATRKSSESPLPKLTEILTQRYKKSSSQLQMELLDVINQYSSSSLASYISFLSLPFVPSLKSYRINFKSLAEHLPLDTLSDDQKVDLLYNIIKNSGEMTYEFVLACSQIAGSISSQLTTDTEKADFEYEDYEDNTKHWKVISQEKIEVIKSLFNRDFISFSAQKIKDKKKLSQVYISSLYLIPSMKSTFIIYLIPGMFEITLNTVIRNKIFKKIVDLDEDHLFSVSNGFLSELLVDNFSFLFRDLRLFLELLNYRLIISNDFELFTSYGFTTEKFKLITLFLKRLVFNQIWNHQKIKPFITTKLKYNALTELTTAVLTQIYLKDSRQKVLPDDIWLINVNKVYALTDTIINYERQKLVSDRFSDDEGEYLSSLNSDVQAKLQIYLNAPFFIPFMTRVEIFQSLVKEDKVQSSYDNEMAFFGQFIQTRHPATIRREHILEDAFTSFNAIGQNFKSDLRIKFVNQNGEEAGVDGGGLTKEFLTSTIREGFKELFVSNPQHELYPDPEIGLSYQYRIDTEKNHKSLEYIKFLGKIIGKCLYERILVEVNFSSFFLSKLNSRYRNSFDDLQSLDKEVYSNLIKMVNMSDQELENLSLTFNISEKVGAKPIFIDLIPNGSNVYVNSSNKFKFLHEYSKFKLDKRINLQSNFFLSGLFEMIPRDWLSMFNPYELQMLISGEREVDIEDLKKYTVYGRYPEDHKNIKNFWEVVEEMNFDNKSKLIKFVTSVPRAPLQGFKALNPNFGITSVESTDRLPTSSTCVNLLLLPNYSNKETLKEKLLYAINAEAGFDLA